MAASMVALFSWGANSYGQLNLGDTTDRLLPCSVPEHPTQIQQLDGGGGHTSIVTKNGQVFVCGHNNKGQLGLGLSDESRLTIHRVPSLPPVRKVACGWEHTLAITETGELWVLGCNNYGQTGGEEKSCSTPKICETGELWVLGCNNYGQTGGEEKSCSTPKICENFNGQSVIDVAAGLRHSLAISSDGAVWSWGSGKKGQLGWVDGAGQVQNQMTKPMKVMFSDGSLRPMQVAAGAYHSMLLTEDGCVFCWGDNKRGQMGLCPQTRHNGARNTVIKTPTKISSKCFDGRRIKYIGSGWTHCIAVTEDGHAYSWGRHDYGQLGRNVGTEEATAPPYYEPGLIPIGNIEQIACGSEHTLAISDGLLYAWGWNEHGMCATGNEDNVPDPRPIQHFSRAQPLLIGAGAGHCIVLCKNAL